MKNDFVDMDIPNQFIQGGGGQNPQILLIAVRNFYEIHQFGLGGFQRGGFYFDLPGSKDLVRHMEILKSDLDHQTVAPSNYRPSSGLTLTPRNLLSPPPLVNIGTKPPLDSTETTHIRVPL